MNLGLEIVSSVLTTGELSYFTDCGFNSVWLSSPSASIIFTGLDKAAYEWLLKYYARHHVVPSLDIFREQFPEVSYKLQKEIISTGQLIDLVFDKVSAYQVADLITKSIALHDAGKISEAVELIKSTASTLSPDVISLSSGYDITSPDFDINKLLDTELEQGIPFGFNQIDDVYWGFHPGQLVTLLGRQKASKALDIDTMLPTPTGWTTMSDVKVGDYLMDANGSPTKVTAATEVMYGHDCYEITFSDGAKIIADAGHQWLVDKRVKKKSLVYETDVLTTEEISRNPKSDGGKVNRYRVQVTKPLTFPGIDLPIDPYILGYWLGDGTSSTGEITVHVDDLENLLINISKAGYYISGNRPSGKGEHVRVINISDYPVKLHGPANKEHTLVSKLRSNALLNNKHIPAQYLRAGTYQRLRLLQGIMDSDGYAHDKGFSITQKDRDLLNNIRELMNTMGIQTRLSTQTIRINDKLLSYGTLNFYGNTDVAVFSLPRKASILPKWHGNRADYRHITYVKKVESVPVKCVEVDNPEHLYLAGSSMIPTHNSWLTLNSAFNAWMKGYSVLFFSVEMGEELLQQRLLCLGAHISPSRMRRGNLHPGEKEKARDFQSLLSKNGQGRFIISRKKTLITLDDIAEEVSKYRPHIVYIDGFSFMVDRRTGRMTDDWQANENVAAELKAFSMDKELVVFVNTQVQEKQYNSSRGIEARSIAGGTGLLKASDYVIGLDKDKETKIITLSSQRSRFEDFDDFHMEIDFENMSFTIKELETEEKMEGKGI